MTVHTRYFVEISIDWKTSKRIVESRKEDEFDKDFLKATEGSDTAGTNSYSTTTLWAETSSSATASQIDTRFNRLAAKWDAWAQLPREE